MTEFPHSVTKRRFLSLGGAGLTSLALGSVAGGLAAPALVRAQTLADGAELLSEVPKGTKLTFTDQHQINRVNLEAAGGLAALSAVLDLDWVNVIGNTLVLESLRTGGSDGGWGGDVSPALAKSQGFDVAYIGITQASRNQYGFYVAPGRGDITSASQLKGKQIAYPSGTQMAVYIRKVLRRAGLGESDVELVELQVADIPDAVRTGLVDAGAIWGASRLRLEAELGDQGFHALPEGLDLGSGIMPIYALRSTLADPAKAAALAKFSYEWTKAQLWINDHHAEWGDAFYVQLSNFTPEESLQLAAREGEYSVPGFRDDVLDRLQADIDFQVEFGALKVRSDVRDLIDPRFEAVQLQAAADYAAAKA